MTRGILQNYITQNKPRGELLLSFGKFMHEVGFCLEVMERSQDTRKTKIEVIGSKNSQEFGMFEVI
jgi:hypothetical protein